MVQFDITSESGMQEACVEFSKKHKILLGDFCTKNGCSRLQQPYFQIFGTAVVINTLSKTSVGIFDPIDIRIGLVMKDLHHTLSIFQKVVGELTLSERLPI